MASKVEMSGHGSSTGTYLNSLAGHLDGQLTPPRADENHEDEDIDGEECRRSLKVKQRQRMERDIREQAWGRRCGGHDQRGGHAHGHCASLKSHAPLSRVSPNFAPPENPSQLRTRRR